MPHTDHSHHTEPHLPQSAASDGAFSLLRAGASLRVVYALGLSVPVWLCVLWALA